MKVKQTIKEFYNNQAEKFSQTRTKIWPEFNYVAQEVERLLAFKDKIKILELGCGDGRLYRFLAEKFPGKIDYVGVDISEWLIQIAKSVESEKLKLESNASQVNSEKWIVKNNFEWWRNNRERWNSYAEFISASDAGDDKSLQTSWNSSDLLLSIEGNDFRNLNQDNLWLSSIDNSPAFIVSDMLEYLENVEPETFDFVVAVASFQHIPTRWERLLILKHIYRILNYGGETMMFNWSFSKWFFKKYKWQVLKSFVLGILSLGTKPINDIMVPWKAENKTFYRYYHIFFLFELKKLFKQAGFVIKEACYINKRGEKTISRIDSRNSCIIWIKKVTE